MSMKNMFPMKAAMNMWVESFIFEYTQIIPSRSKTIPIRLKTQDMSKFMIPPIPTGNLTNSYWKKCPFMVDLAIKHGDFPVR